jgi:hypothetical protein
MPFRLLASSAVATVAVNAATTNITTSAWAQIVAAMPKACTAVEVYNPSGSTLQIAVGGAGSEVALPYTIIPGGETTPIPLEIAKGARVTLKAIDTTVSTGYITINFFG